jgi:hypothetical protein
MKMFAESLFAIDWLFATGNRQYLIGCGVAAVAFGIACVVFGRSRKSSRRELLDDYQPGKSASDHDDNRFGDRRTQVRREGKPVPIHITAPVFQDGTKEGYVLDRSTGGLKLAIDTPVAPGTTMQILAMNAPDTTPWVTIIVRSCAPMGKRFDLGCEFETTPPWNILLLFG